jgi:ABC-type nitrate/sulfonate/bicarbonate transport system substrate-binding protein
MRWAADAPPWAARAEAVIAQEKGFFRDAGIETAEIEVIAGERKGIEALLNGKIDFLSGLSRKALIAHSHGAPIRIIGISKNKIRAGLAVDPKLGDPKNLTGKTVAVGIFGAVVERLSKMSVKLLGVDPDQVNYVEVGTGSKRIAAVLKGEIQAAIMMNSHVEAARLAGLRVYETISGLYPKYAFHVLSTTCETLEKRPVLVTAMLEGCVRGHRLLWDDASIEEVAPLFSAQVPGGSREEWEAERKDVLLSCTHDLEIEDDALGYAVKFEQEWGLLPPAYDYRPIVERRPLAEALRRIDGRRA